MPVTRHDAVLQAVRELGRHAPALAEATRAEHPGTALQRIQEACVAVLGMELPVLTRFDARSVVGLFSHPEQVRILARFVDLQARVLEAHGRAPEALEHSHYAWQLLACSRSRFGVHRDGRAADLLHEAVGSLPPLD